jgi:hypothetical protein
MRFSSWMREPNRLETDHLPAEIGPAPGAGPIERPDAEGSVFSAMERKSQTTGREPIDHPLIPTPSAAVGSLGERLPDRGVDSAPLDHGDDAAEPRSRRALP